MPIQRTVNHFLWRAGFGPTVHQLNQAVPPTPESIYRLLASKDRPPRQAHLSQQVEWVLEERATEAFQQQIREFAVLGNAFALQGLVEEPAQLREKLVFFWQDHFACRTPLYPFQEQFYNILQTHALGSFADLLHEVARAPAMLQFLNNQQNRKQAPNENFAREVMELFTLGRGNYTEKDISEAARAFTGWGFDREGKYIYRSWQHDSGPKHFRGKTGNFRGEDILNLLLEDRQTAQYVTEKLYRFFVHPTAPPHRVKELADRFYTSGYQIEPLVRTLLLEDAAQPELHGTRIKTPIELVAGLMRLFGIRFQNAKGAYYLQKVLGQILMMPPSVNGWPEGREWIDGASLVLRLRLGEALLISGALGVEAKEGGDAQDPSAQFSMMRSLGGGGRELNQIRRTVGQLETGTDFEPFAQLFEGSSGTALVESLAEALLQVPLSQGSRDILRTRLNDLRAAYGGRSEVFVATILIVGLPEYQLC